MKLKSLLFVLLLALVPAVFTACNDDDEPADATEISGTYTGTLEATVMTTLCNFDGDYSVVITSGSDSSASVKLPECSFVVPGTEMPLTIPSLTVSNGKVAKEGKEYTISCDATEIEVNGVKYPVSLSGKISGSQATLTYSLQPGRMPMPINFSFKGKK